MFYTLTQSPLLKVVDDAKMVGCRLFAKCSIEKIRCVLGGTLASVYLAVSELREVVI